MVSRCCVPLSLPSVLPPVTLLPTWAVLTWLAVSASQTLVSRLARRGRARESHACSVDPCAPGVAIPRLDLTAEKGGWSLPSEDQLALQVQTRALGHVKTARGCHALFLLWPCSLCRQHTDRGKKGGAFGQRSPSPVLRSVSQYHQAILQCSEDTDWVPQTQASSDAVCSETVPEPAAAGSETAHFSVSPKSRLFLTDRLHSGRSHSPLPGFSSRTQRNIYLRLAIYYAGYR